MSIIPFKARYERAQKGLEAIREPEEIKEFLVQMTSQFGLKTAAYLAVSPVHKTPKADEPFFSCTYSSQWVQRYVDRQYVQIDPVLKRGLSSVLPLNWDELQITDPKLKRFFGEAREHGIGSQGVTFPIRGRNGERAIFTITADETDRAWKQMLRDNEQDLQVLSFLLHEASNRVRGIETEVISLSQREFECLRSAAKGLTAAQIAQKLGLTERTARFYLDTARIKLGATNITHAVAKAIDLGLLFRGR
jgi:DNA-binding CsgD family transcriptional regulator